VLFAIPPVLPIAIDLVRMYRLRIAAKPFPVGFDLSDQIDPLVEVVPADPVYEADAIDKADADLGPKFRVRSGLAAFDGTYMRLADAHDAIVNAQAVVVVHPLLLALDLGDNQQILV
jgi:hypothetical protein